MTFREWSMNELVNNGMFESQATQVVDSVGGTDETQPTWSKDMQKLWGEDIEGYPTSLRAVVKMAVYDAAVQWIDANLPKAWFRPMFVL